MTPHQDGLYRADRASRQEDYSLFVVDVLGPRVHQHDADLSACLFTSVRESHTRVSPWHDPVTYALGHAYLCVEGVYDSRMGSHGYAPSAMCFTDEHFVMVYCKGNEKHLYVQCFPSDVYCYL